MLEIRIIVLLLVFRNAAAQQTAIAEFNDELDNLRGLQRQRERRMVRAQVGCLEFYSLWLWLSCYII